MRKINEDRNFVTVKYNKDDYAKNSIILKSTIQKIMQNNNQENVEEQAEKLFEILESEYYSAAGLYILMDKMSTTPVGFAVFARSVIDDFVTLHYISNSDLQNAKRLFADATKDIYAEGWQEIYAPVKQNDTKNIELFGELVESNDHKSHAFSGPNEVVYLFNPKKLENKEDNEIL